MTCRPLDSLERRNLAQIEGLNQRGGRMLSVVDLLDAGTVDLNMASCLCALAGRGASFLSGAVPGGAGKTTVMAAILAFLPPAMEIVTVDDERVTAAAGGGCRCYLAHEIGSGHWYGYIWGRAVRDYLDLAARGQMIASGLHADTLQQMRDMLLSPPLAVGEAALAALGFTLFVAVQRSGSGLRRRVSVVHGGAGAHAQPLFYWNPQADRFDARADLDAYVPAAERAALRGLLADLRQRGVRRIEDVRAAYLDLLGRR